MNNFMRVRFLATVVSVVALQVFGAIVSDVGYTDVTADDLAAVQSAEDILLGPATLRYTGTTHVAIPGFTINNTGTGSAVFDILNRVRVTVGSIVTGAGSPTNCLVKLGKGILLVTGDSSIGGATGAAGWDLSLTDDATIGAPGDGTGPTVNVGALNANGGDLQIGDATHAPRVDVNGPFVIGGKSYLKSSGETPASLYCIISNGTVNVRSGSDLWLGFYGPSYVGGATAHAICRHYGGVVNLTGTSNESGLLRIGYAAGKLLMNGQPTYELHGGEFNCKGVQTAAVGRKGSDYGPYQTLTLYGGVMNVDGDVRFGLCSDSPRSYLYGHGGRLDVSGTLYCCYNASIEYTLRDWLEFNSGFTLKVSTIVGRRLDGVSSSEYVRMTFNGGTWEQPYGADAKIDRFLGKDVFIIDNGGMNLLLTNDVAGVAGVHSLTIDVKATGTGDIVARGPGKLCFGSTFKTSTFTGKLVAREGATIMLNDEVAAKFPVTVGRDGRVAGTGSVKSLTIGIDGETTPIVPGLTMPNDLAVTTCALGGSVSFEPSAPGDYPILVYENGIFDDSLLSLTGPLAKSGKAKWVSEPDVATGKNVLKIRVRKEEGLILIFR